MGVEALQQSGEKISQAQPVDIHSTGANEYESLINSTAFDAEGLYTPSLTELLKGPSSTSSEAEKATEIRDASRVATADHPSEQAIEQVMRYLEAHPERAAPSLVKALGEHLVIDAANDASVLSRAELDKKLKENPELSFFTRVFIDRVGIAQGFRWVPDKDVASSVQEALLAKHTELSKGRFRRAYDVLMGKDANLFKALTEQVENLYAAKLAVERDIQEQKIILASTIKEIDQREAESRFRLLEENKKIVVEQIARQEQLIVDLRVAQDEITRVRDEHSQEIIAHHKRMGDLENEYQKSRSQFTTQIAELESQLNQKQLESQRAINALAANVNQAEATAQIKIAQLESKFRLSELELQAKLGASEARFEERKAAIRTQISALTSEHNGVRIAHGLKPEADTSLAEYEKGLVDQIHNMVLFEPQDTFSNLFTVIRQSLTTLAEVDEVLGAEDARLLARRIQNEIGQMFKDVKFDLKLDMIKLLSCPNFTEAKGVIESVAEDRNQEQNLLIEVTLYLEKFKLNSFKELYFHSNPSNGYSKSIGVDDYKVLRKLATDNNVTVDELVGGLHSNNSRTIERINISHLIKAGIRNAEALKEFSTLLFVDIESGPSVNEKEAFFAILKCLSPSLKFTVKANALRALAESEFEIKDLTVTDLYNTVPYYSSDIHHVTKIKSLENLTLKETEVNDTNLEQLSALPALKTLRVHSLIGLDPCSELVKFPALEEISTHRIYEELRHRILTTLYIKVLTYIVDSER